MDLEEARSLGAQAQGPLGVEEEVEEVVGAEQEAALGEHLASEVEEEEEEEESQYLTAQE